MVKSVAMSPLLLQRIAGAGTGGSGERGAAGGAGLSDKDSEMMVDVGGGGDDVDAQPAKKFSGLPRTPQMCNTCTCMWPRQTAWYIQKGASHPAPERGLPQCHA